MSPTSTRKQGGPLPTGQPAPAAKTRRGGSRGLRIRRQRLGWKGHSVLACAAAVAGLVAWAVIARALAPKENTTQEHFDVLMVLGSPADADGNPTPTQLERVTEAVNEYERGVAPRMIITGGPAHNQFVEAEVMARGRGAGDSCGRDRGRESGAEHDGETCDSLRIMRSHGWESAEVISSASHLPRAGLDPNRLPLKWRTHAAPALEPEGPGRKGR